MTFTVEDGTGVEDANSLTSIAFADEYFADRGVTTWTGTNEQKQQWLIQATDYFELRFGQRLKSCKVEEDQSLSFPRDDYDGVPVKIQKGISEYALRAKSGALMPDPVVDTSGMAIKRIKKGLGPLEKDIEYANTNVRVFKPYPAADNYFAEFIYRANRTIR